MVSLLHGVMSQPCATGSIGSTGSKMSIGHVEFFAKWSQAVWLRILCVRIGFERYSQRRGILDLHTVSMHVVESLVPILHFLDMSSGSWIY